MRGVNAEKHTRDPADTRGDMVLRKGVKRLYDLPLISHQLQSCTSSSAS